MLVKAGRGVYENLVRTHVRRSRRIRVPQERRALASAGSAPIAADAAFAVPRLRALPAGLRLIRP